MSNIYNKIYISRIHDKCVSSIAYKYSNFYFYNQCVRSIAYKYSNFYFYNQCESSPYFIY